VLLVSRVVLVRSFGSLVRHRLLSSRTRPLCSSLRCCARVWGSMLLLFFLPVRWVRLFLCLLARRCCCSRFGTCSVPLCLVVPALALSSLGALLMCSPSWAARLASGISRYAPFRSFDLTTGVCLRRVGVLSFFFG